LVGVVVLVEWLVSMKVSRLFLSFCYIWPLGKVSEQVDGVYNLTTENEDMTSALWAAASGRLICLVFGVGIWHG